MIEQFKRISTIAAVAVILALGTATSARANLEIQLSLNGTSYTTVASGPSGGLLTFNSASTGWSTSGIQIKALSTDSNSPGSSTLAELDGSTLSLTNLTSATKTLYIKLGDTGFLAPVVPPGYLIFDSNIAGNVSVGKPANSLVFQSYVDPADGQNTTTGLTTGPQTPPITAAGGYFNDATTNVFSLASGYSMTEFFKVTLGGGGKISFATTTSLTLVPEPSSLAIAALGGLGLVGIGLRRRHKGAEPFRQPHIAYRDKPDPRDAPAAHAGGGFSFPGSVR